MRRETDRSLARPKSLLGRKKRNRRKTVRGASAEGAGLGVVRAVLSIVLGLSALAGAALGLVYGYEALRSSRQLAVKRVEVTGNGRARLEELEVYTGVKPGHPILDVDLDAVALQLRRHPWVDVAEVRRRLPDEVSIHVREHEPALIVSMGDVYLANANGELFKRLSPSDEVVTPVLTGLSRDDAKLRAEATQATIREAIALVSAYNESATRLGRLDEIRWDEDLGWGLIITPSGESPRSFRAQLGHTGAARLSVVLAAVERLHELGRMPRVIWADGHKHPERVHVRAYDTPHTPLAQTLIATAR